MRLRLIVRATALLAVMLAMSSGGLASASAPSPVGIWLTPDGNGVIQVRPCQTGFCGRIVGMSQIVGDDGEPPADPQGRPNCGRDILHVSREVEPGTWAGEILNPDDGSIWRCEVWLDQGKLHLRGYVLTPLLGQTQDWTPYQGQVTPDCRMTS